MRTGFLTATLLLFLGSTCLAENWAEAMFDHTSHNFGVVARGAKVEHRFPFENKYEEDVHVVSVKASCGCTRLEVTKKTIGTWETSEVVMLLDTRKFQGRKDAVITVKLEFIKQTPNGPVRSGSVEVRLPFYSYIRRDVVLQPGSAQFGSVAAGVGAQKKVTLSFAGSPGWAITGLGESVSPYLGVRVVELGRNAGRVTYQIAVELKSDAPVGQIREFVELITNDTRPNAGRVLLLVEGEVTSSLAVRPSPLSFGVLNTGTSVTKTLVVRSEKAFLIEKITCPDDRIGILLPEVDVASAVYVVPITFTAGGVAGAVDTKLIVQTDLAGGESVEVLVDGRILEPDPPDDVEPEPLPPDDEAQPVPM